METNAINGEDDKMVSKEYETDYTMQQQKWLELTVHFADVSFQTRELHISKMWMRLLFDEFFN